jgi:trigger factor
VLGRFGMLAPHDGPAEADDFVVVDMTCRHGGQVISEAREQTVRVRPTISFIDGNLTDFDALMEGAKAGETRKAPVTLSEDAPNEQLRGQEVEVSLEVLEVKKLQLPPMNEAFLKRIGSFESEGDLRDAIEYDLQRQLVYHQQRSVRRQITSLLTESAAWDLPPELLKRQSQRELERALMELRSAGFTEQEIRAQANILRQNSQASTATALKEHFILERIAEDQQLEAEPQDFDREIALIAAQSDESPRSVRARFEKRGLMDALRNQIIERKAIDLITSEATFKDVEYTPPRDETFAVDHALGGRGEPEIPEAKHTDVKKLSEPADHS